jgi:hypothetical protein
MVVVVWSKKKMLLLFCGSGGVECNFFEVGSEVGWKDSSY